VEALEAALGRWAHGLHVRAVSSCTAAIHITLDYFKQCGSSVITSAVNWPGAVGPIHFVGLKPHFVDISPVDGCIDEEHALDALSDETAGILVTHLFGNAAVLPNLRTSARSLGAAAIVDDCAQAVSAVNEWDSTHDLQSDAILLSGNGAKHLGAGELGLICTRQESLIEHVEAVSLASSSRRGDRIFSPMTYGYNYRPNAFSAAIALTRVEELDEQIRSRRRNASTLWRRLSSLPGLHPLFERDQGLNSFCSFPLRVEPEALGLPARPEVRDFIVQLISSEGVPVGVWLRKPVWEYLPFWDGRWSRRDFPNSARLLDTMLHLPEVAPPNDASTMALYADSFEKVWDALPHLTDRILAGTHGR
jgi:dTDP-4-amino-4,6-dideoxygalactose transaminase